jgi:nicotinate (nicotinamide) nucleotide adenylyltransferase
MKPLGSDISMGRASDISARFQDVIAEVEGSTKSTISFFHAAENEVAGGRKKLGVFPSSFNPITIAHKEISLRARDAFRFDEILLLLDRRNADKEVFGAPLEDRLAMILEFCKDSPHLSSAMASHGLFVEKVPAVAEAYANDVMIHFILGQDTIERVLDARYYSDKDRSLSELFKRAHFIVVPRGGKGKEGLEVIFDQPANRPYRKRIEVMPLERRFHNISSTKVRQLIAKKKPFEHLVPEPVSRYIKHKGLYIMS